MAGAPDPVNALRRSATFLALGAALLACASAPASQPLVPLARPGPWSAVSGLIGYGERLWFVNSVKFVDHNSADVYSYDPVTGNARYERHLFSQDAGDPTVAEGLLYWPFEDARFSVGRGEFMVTNGRDWQWRIVSDAEVFHVHAMAADRGVLYAATSAWRAGLQRSDDGGVTWRTLYDHPTSQGLVSRITTLAVVDGTLYAGLTASEDGVKLLWLTGGTLQPVTRWPRGRMVTAVKAYRGWLYAVNRGAGGSAVWRTDGRHVERVTGLDREPVRALAAGPDAIWAVSAHEGRGTLWRSAGGVSWTTAQRFDGAEPVDVAVYADRAYVGTIGPGERGTLWGPRPPAPAEPALGASPLPAAAPRPTPPAGIGSALANLDRTLGESASYAAHGARLREAIEALALSGEPEIGAELSRRLDGPFPETSVRLFGGALQVPAAPLGRWYLLWALARNGHGRVPSRLLEAPWTERSNRAEKYLNPAPAAAWAIAQSGQADAETLGALVRRLGAAGQPQWLDGDFVGALTALTAERFGYDVAAWRAWWCEPQDVAGLGTCRPRRAVR